MTNVTTPSPGSLKIGFIGIGLMGEPMVLRLLESRYPVTVWNREPDRLEPVVAAGAVAARSPAEVAAASDIVMLCVLDTKAVESVVFGPDGVASARVEGKVLIDFSTIDPDGSRQFAERLRSERGMGWIDAPVSGGPPAARLGQLVVMAGGASEDIERVRPVMDRLAARCTHMGNCGAGQITKVINQAICGTGYVQMAEALSLALAAGIDASKLPECLSGGHADSTMLRLHFPRMVARDFEHPASYARQMLKDLRSVADYAARFGKTLPLVDTAVQRYQTYVDAGNGLAETASISLLYDSDAPTPAPAPARPPL
jgi:3-hydroxyisobutyrate dehydrogenase